MQDSPTLPESDVRAMVHLLGEVAALAGEHSAKKIFLMRGVCELIGADKWAWALICDFAPSQPPVVVDFHQHGFSDAELGSFLRACKPPQPAHNPAAIMFACGENHIHLTRRREPINPENKVPELALLGEQVEVGAVMMARHPVSANGQSLIGFYRGLNLPPFTARESRIAHIILSEVSWLHEQGWPENRPASVPPLSPRLRMTLDLLLNGRSRKEIAGLLEISINTVAGYVRDVYRLFQVRSHAELLHRLPQSQKTRPACLAAGNKK